MKLEINAVNKIKVTTKIKNNVEQKLRGLERFIPKHAQKSAHLRVILSETSKKPKKAICEGILALPNQRIVCKEEASNMLAAIDLVSNKMARQIKKYKTARVESVKKDNFFKRLLGKAQSWKK